MTEEVCVFGQEKNLTGVLTRPEEDVLARGRPGIVILNAGLVHRVGPNRLGVKFARRFAELGHPVLRFDHAGIGDSPARRDGLPFRQSALAEAREAMDRLGESTGTRRFILTGICTGASVSFGAALADPRVAGAMLINLRTLLVGAEDAVSRRALHIAEARRILRWSLPLDLATRAIGVRKTMWVVWDLVRDLPKGKQVAGEAARLRELARQLTDRRVPLLFVCSPWDSAYHYQRLLFSGDFPAERRKDTVTIEVTPSADHTFTALDAQERLLKVVGDWLGRQKWQSGSAE